MRVYPAAKWYVVQTQPNAERRASEHLQRQGFETYLPQYLRRRRHARRVETVIAPLFPRYIFVNVDMEMVRWRCIHSTTGVSRLICNGNQPAPIQPHILSEIREREDAAWFDQIESRPRFAPGDKIRVLNGVFSGSQGLFDSVEDGQRVAILLDLLGRKVRAVLDMDLVDAI